MNDYGIKVPFPEVMTQEDYDKLYYQKVFNENFENDKYEKYCDIIDNAVKELLNGKDKVFIEKKDIYILFNNNYVKTKRDIVKAHYGYELIYEEDIINNGFYLKLKESGE